MMPRVLPESRGRGGSRRRRQHPSGSVLILALWALFFLAALAIAVGAHVSGCLNVAGRVQAETTAYYLARAGVESAVAVLNSDSNEWDASTETWADGKSLFKDQAMGGGRYSLIYAATSASGEVVTNYGLTDEEQRVNINKASVELLRAVVATAGGADPDTASRVAACIVDWRDKDNNLLTGGAENDYYHSLSPAYSSHNDELGSVAELMLVKGMDRDLFGKLEPYLTVYGSGLINANTAGRVVLTSLALSVGVGDLATCRSLVDRMMAIREGGSVFRSKGEVAAWQQTGSLPPVEAMVFGRMAITLDVRSTCFRGAVQGEVEGQPVEQSRIVFVYDRKHKAKVHWYEF